MNNHDNKQYQLMENYMVEFEEGSLKISQLIELLDGLIQSLENTDENWIDKFRSEWWTLEQTYAVAVDRGENYLNSESESLIDEAVENMRMLLNGVSSNTILPEENGIALDFN
jgi:hypothetical protein